MAALLGPPELSNYNPKSLPQDALATTETSPPSDAFVDLMVSKFNTTTIIHPNPQMGLTENNSSTFLSSGNPCLDFFFHIVPYTPSDSLTERLHVAWSHNPLTTLKLVCNLCGIRRTGKNHRESFYTAATWLFYNHPKILAANVPSFAEFGFFKDLPEILYRLLEGSDVRKNQKEQWLNVKGSSKMNRIKKMTDENIIISSRSRGRFKRRGGARHPGARSRRELKLVKEKKVTNGESEKERARSLREEKKLAMAKKLLDRYNNDANFRLLHDSVSDHFAFCLKNDLVLFDFGELRNISLAAKWFPSVDSSFDRSTLLCESIARRIFPCEGYSKYERIEEAHYAYRVRDRLGKDVLVPLRKVLELPEVYIGANRWDLIPYNKVASVAMKFYKEKFLKHDKERFQKYLNDVKLGKATIAAGALLPHEIISSLWYGGGGGEVAELQWNRMVSDMLKEGKLRNCLAVCNVSGSMWDLPMEVSVALGLLVSELSEEPWKGKVITFSENPQLHLIEGDDLQSKTEFIRDMEFGMNTNFQSVFDRILEVAVNGSLNENQIIKRVIVFSDMEFEQASTTDWETDYQAITRKYSEKGYGSAVPQIIFWNLRHSKATPVTSTQKRVALVSGFSKNLLTLFLDNDGEISPEASVEDEDTNYQGAMEDGDTNSEGAIEDDEISPESTMKAAISGPQYQKLVVLD